jgi:hypothetical protein
VGVTTGDWEARFWEVWNRTAHEQREVFTGSSNLSPYEACNERQLENAQRTADEITLIALFDGTASGSGGTCDLIQRVRAAGGQTQIIDTKNLLARRN